MQRQPQAAPVEQFEQSSINIVYNVCSIVTMPVEMALRPFHGTRYFSPIHMCFSAIMMIFVPLLFSFAGAVGSFLPFAHPQGAVGLIGMWGLSRLFFLGCAIHGVRKWRLMLHMEKEQLSQFEGSPLFFFEWLPKATFWKIRIIYEPLFLLLLSSVVPNFFILENSASNFLMLSAFFLAMKNYTAWYIQWQLIRELLDAKFSGPIIAALIENRATEEDLNRVHLASLPKDLPDDMRRDVAEAYKARVMS